MEQNEIKALVEKKQKELDEIIKQIEAIDKQLNQLMAQKNQLTTVGVELQGGIKALNEIAK